MTIEELQLIADRNDFPGTVTIFEHEGAAWIRHVFDGGPTLGNKLCNLPVEYSPLLERAVKIRADQAREWLAHYEYRGDWSKASPGYPGNIERRMKECLTPDDYEKITAIFERLGAWPPA